MGYIVAEISAQLILGGQFKSAPGGVSLVRRQIQSGAQFNHTIWRNAKMRG